MNWLGNKPVSVVTAWNTLCEAVWERMEFYQFSGTRINNVELLPPIPSQRSTQRTIRAMIPAMQNIISRLLGCSFDPAKLGKWSAAIVAPSKPNQDDPLFFADGFDPYAFFLKPEYLPSYRHGISDFISAAARIVNDKIRYPLPTAGSDSSAKTGFMVECDLYLKNYTSNTEIHSSWLGNGGIHAENDAGIITNLFLAAWFQDKYCGRSYHHRWYYFPTECRYERTPYVQPVLSGTGKLRSQVSASWHGGEIFSNTQEFTIDFAQNRALNEIDFSPAADNVRKVLNGEITDSNNAFVTASWIKQCEIFLDEGNFPKLNYKYME